MKYLLCLFTVMVLLGGCSVNSSSDLDEVMALREKLLTGNCSFSAEVTADYGDSLSSFRMDCNTDAAGNLSFTITEPASIAGITGTIDATDAKLTFDGVVLSFPRLVEGQLTPITSPWVLIHTLRSGYLSGCGSVNDGICILVDDTYEENTLRLEILTDASLTPINADIYWNQNRILTLKISDFVIV